MQNESDGVGIEKKSKSAGRREKQEREETQNIFCLILMPSKCLHHYLTVIDSSDSDGDGGAKQPLQQSHRGDMDDGGFHPAARPPFVCGLIYVSAVTSSAEQA